jgi:serine/threonine protein kinase
MLSGDDRLKWSRCRFRPLPASFPGVLPIGGTGFYRAEPVARYGDSDHERGGEMLQLEGFRNVEQLGSGGLGDVYRAVRISTGGTVAIKVLRDRSDPALAWQRAQREVNALIGLQGHANVVHIEEVVQVDGLLALVMEHAPGGSVYDLMRRRGAPLPLPEVVLVGMHTASALAASHQRGLIHRDIKPHNLLIGAFGQVKVCDFGIAAMTHGGASSDHTDAFSYRYASPEELRGDREVTPSTDIYSLAATLVHLLTGDYMPSRFSGPVDVDVLERWSTRHEYSEPIISRVTSVIMRCADVNPNARPTAAEVVDQFERLAADLGDQRCRDLEVAADGDKTVVRHVAVPRDVSGPAAIAPKFQPAGGSPQPGFVDHTIIGQRVPVPVPWQPAGTWPQIVLGPPARSSSNAQIGIVVAAFVAVLAVCAIAFVILGRSSETSLAETDERASEQTANEQRTEVGVDTTPQTAASQNSEQTGVAATALATVASAPEAIPPETTITATTTTLLAATVPPTTVLIVVNEQSAVSHFTEYLAVAADRQYPEAWAMLSTPYQGKYRGYDKFVDFWETVDGAGIYTIETTFVSDSVVTLRCEVWFGKRVDGTLSNELIEVDLVPDQTTGLIIVGDYRFIGEL